MEKVIKEFVYKAFDGAIFETEKDCKEHENEVREKRLKYNVLVGNRYINKAEVIGFFKQLKCVTCPFKEECSYTQNHDLCHQILDIRFTFDDNITNYEL